MFAVGSARRIPGSGGGINERGPSGWRELPLRTAKDGLLKNAPFTNGGVPSPVFALYKGQDTISSVSCVAKVPDGYREPRDVTGTKYVSVVTPRQAARSPYSDA